MGLFGVAEVLDNIEKEGQRGEILKTSMKGLLPNLQDWKDSLLPIFRGTVIGFLLGTIPGGGNVMTTFSSYAVEKRISKYPERFGKGAIEESQARGRKRPVAAHYVLC
jgi:putative tricarboxylic transport membrane protein